MPPDIITLVTTAEVITKYSFHVITFWYMALKLSDRPLYMLWIAKNLTYKDRSGNDTIEDQGIVTMDMMERLAYSDREETGRTLGFAGPNDGEVSQKTWIIGLSLLTIETAGRTGVSQITRRRPVRFLCSFALQVCTDRI